MKVKELIEKLQNYNPEAKVDIIVNNMQYDFSLAYGGSDGSTKKTAISVDFCVDKLCKNEQTQSKPTPMPEWLEKQFDSAERTVANWSEGKKEAAGLTNKKIVSGLDAILLTKSPKYIFVITRSSYKHQLTPEGYIDGNKPSIPCKQEFLLSLNDLEEFHEAAKGYLTRSSRVEKVHCVENSKIVDTVEFATDADRIKFFAQRKISNNKDLIENIEPSVEKTEQSVEIKNPTLNEIEIEMIKFCLKVNKNLVGGDMYVSGIENDLFAEKISEDYKTIMLDNGIEYKLDQWHKNLDKIEDYDMIYYFPDEQLGDDDALIFCGDGTIMYGS
jgi:hypothetical protein